MPPPIKILTAFEISSPSAIATAPLDELNISVAHPKSNAKALPVQICRSSQSPLHDTLCSALSGPCPLPSVAATTLLDELDAFVDATASTRSAPLPMIADSVRFDIAPLSISATGARSEGKPTSILGTTTLLLLAIATTTEENYTLVDVPVSAVSLALSSTAVARNRQLKVVDLLIAAAASVSKSVAASDVYLV
jgi:hypothetical protein